MSSSAVLLNINITKPAENKVRVRSHVSWTRATTNSISSTLGVVIVVVVIIESLISFCQPQLRSAHTNIASSLASIRQMVGVVIFFSFSYACAYWKVLAVLLLPVT